MLYVRQEDTPYLHPMRIQELLKDTATMKFMDSADNPCSASKDLSNTKEVSVHIFIMSFLHVLLEIQNIIIYSFELKTVLSENIYIGLKSKAGLVHKNLTTHLYIKFSCA